MTWYGELVQIMATTLSKESPFLSRLLQDFLYSCGLFVLDKQTSGLCVVAQYHLLHPVENYEHNCGKADILAGVPVCHINQLWEQCGSYTPGFLMCLSNVLGTGT